MYMKFYNYEFRRRGREALRSPLGSGFPFWFFAAEIDDDGRLQPPRGAKATPLGGLVAKKGAAFMSEGCLGGSDGSEFHFGFDLDQPW